MFLAIAKPKHIVTKDVAAIKMTEVRLHISVEQNNQMFITSERIDLLQKVQSTGSLHAASKVLKISYQSAWNIIHSINELAPALVVVKQRGGKGGGGAELSDYGKLLLTEYSFIQKQVEVFNKQLNSEINI